MLRFSRLVLYRTLRRTWGEMTLFLTVMLGLLLWLAFLHTLGYAQQAPPPTCEQRLDQAEARYHRQSIDYAQALAEKAYQWEAGKQKDATIKQLQDELAKLKQAQVPAKELPKVEKK